MRGRRPAVPAGLLCLLRLPAAGGHVAGPVGGLAGGQAGDGVCHGPPQGTSEGASLPCPALPLHTGLVTVGPHLTLGPQPAPACAGHDAFVCAEQSFSVRHGSVADWAGAMLEPHPPCSTMQRQPCNPHAKAPLACSVNQQQAPRCGNGRGVVPALCSVRCAQVQELARELGLDRSFVTAWFKEFKAKPKE